MPNAMYRVRLESGQIVLASLGTEAKHSIVRLISGSRVRVKVSSFDPGRGQIQAKLK